MLVFHEAAHKESSSAGGTLYIPCIQVMGRLLLSPCRPTSVVGRAAENMNVAVPCISTERRKQLSLFQSSAGSQGVPVPIYSSVFLVEGVGPAWACLHPGSRHPKYKMRNNRWLPADGGT